MSSSANTRCGVASAWSRTHAAKFRRGGFTDVFVSKKATLHKIHSKDSRRHLGCLLAQYGPAVEQVSAYGRDQSRQSATVSARNYESIARQHEAATREGAQVATARANVES